MKSKGKLIKINPYLRDKTRRFICLVQSAINSSRIEGVFCHNLVEKLVHHNSVRRNVR